MLRDFKEFILRGNVVQLAIAVVIGVAFAAVVSSFVEDLLTPLIAAIGGQQDFSGLTVELNDSTFRYGEFVNAIISFLIVAAVVFFLVVRPINALEKRRRKESPDDPTLKKCPECISEIPADATRCAFCTTAL